MGTQRQSNPHTLQVNLNSDPAASADRNDRQRGCFYVRYNVESIRCASCRRLLMKAAPRAISDTIEIKCPRCGTINALRPVEPQPERAGESRKELPDQGIGTHGQGR
ncbi:Com family DNA-binding transcriptional regulator [Stappia stellulata]|uniref:Com family DNA-binding transcriptional regulator n=1 Tax=Stappia stellulata TaxID=71235 RepID=UPI003CCBC46B